MSGRRGGRVMIVSYATDPFIRSGLLRAGHPEEDVVLDRALADAAMASGYPRVLVALEGEDAGVAAAWDAGVPVVVLTGATLARWEAERVLRGPASRVEWLARNLRILLEPDPARPTWVDRALADLGRAAGRPLPWQLRAFGRRVMEFPSRYDDLHPLAQACGTSRGALKARFRRRGLPSPSVYLRWFRILAVANALSDRSLTVAQLAGRFAFTSDGNLCRALQSLTGLTPTEARTVHGWNRLVVGFAWRHLRPGALDAWKGLEPIFKRRVA